MEQQQKKKKKLYSHSHISTSKTKRKRQPHFDFDVNTTFSLLLAAVSTPHNPYSVFLLPKCLTHLHSALLPQSPHPLQTLPSPILSLLPLLILSERQGIASCAAEIVGAASLLSLRTNEVIALDDGVVRALISVLGCSKRRVALAACNAVLDLSTTSFGRQRLVEFSAIQRLMWEGFVHTAVYSWNWSHNPKQCDTLFGTMSVQLLHFAIWLISVSDHNFRKACLVAACSLPSETNDRLGLIQKTTFSRLLDKISSESKFSEVLAALKISVEKDEDPFHRMRWLRLLNVDGKESIKDDKWTMPSIGIRDLLSTCVNHREQIGTTFVEVKSRFCREVRFKNAVECYQKLLKRFRKVRSQYTNGMISLH